MTTKTHHRLLAILVFAALAVPANGQVSIELLLNSDASISGAGAADVKSFQMPKPNRQGTFYAKAAFHDASEDIPVAGSVIVELTGPNSAQVILRDDLLGLEPLTYTPIFPSDDGTLVFYGKYSDEDSSSSSVFAFQNGNLVRLSVNASLTGQSYNGTAIARRIEDFQFVDLAKILPTGQIQSFPLFGGAVPGIEGASFKAIDEIAYNPSGKLFFAVQIEGEGLDHSNDYLLLSEDGEGNLEIILREGSLYPESPQLPAEGAFRHLGENLAMSCNDLGMLVFRATVDAPDARPNGTAGSVWRHVPGEDPQLVVVDRSTFATANAGDLSIGYLTNGSGENPMVPVLDAAGNVYYAAEVDRDLDESPYGDIGFFKWDGENTHLIGYLNSMLPLPEGIEDPRVRLEEFALSASGRIALYVSIRDGNTGLAASLFAQDDEGEFVEVITRNVSDVVFQRQNLIASGKDYGLAGIIYPPAQDYGYSAAEDGSGHPWWTSDDRLLFSVSYRENDETKSMFCLATIGEPQVPASGNRYTWDGGIDTELWQSVEGGKTNWVDSIGARWNLPPNRSNAEVDIPVLENVILDSGNVEIGSLDARGSLELSAPLKINEDAYLSELSINEGGSLTLNGQSQLYGSIESSGNGILFEPDSDAVALDIRNSITAQQSGVVAFSETGSLSIQNTDNINANSGKGISASAPTGTVSISSRPKDASPLDLPIISAKTGNSILAEAGSDIAVTVVGNLSAIGATSGSTTANVKSISETGAITVVGNGSFEASGAALAALNLYTTADDDIHLTHQGSLDSSGMNIIAETSGGDIGLDVRNAILTGAAGSIDADATTGSISISSGEINASNGSAIRAHAMSDIEILALKSIDLISGDAAIEANSSTGSIEINSSTQISTTNLSLTGIGIWANAAQDISIEQSAPIDSAAAAISATTTSGSVDIDARSAGLSGENGGIRAEATTGSILIRSGEIASSNQPAIHATAAQSVSIESLGDLTAIGDDANGIYADSTTAGVSIIHDGDISATGTNANGILASSPTNINVLIKSGAISGWDNHNAGIVLANAQTATLTNYGDISSASEVGVRSTATESTIENHGRIYGDIPLGDGPNALNNHRNAILYPVSEFSLKSNGALSNNGSIILSEDPEELHTVTLSGNFNQSDSGNIQFQVNPGLASDQLDVIGNATLNGALTVKINGSIEAETEIRLFEATSVDGEFSQTLVANANGLSNEETASHARHYPSRSIDASVMYSETDVTLVLSPLSIDSYESWSDHFLVETLSEDHEPILLADNDHEADPDNDGLSNFAEYVLGTHPLLATPSPFSISASAQTNGEQLLTLSFLVAKQLDDADWILETSDNLEAWQAHEAQPNRITDLGELFRYEYDFQAETNLHALRLRIAPSTN